MNQVDQAFVRLTTPKFEVREPLEIGQDVLFQGKGSVIARSERDLHDGKVTVTSTLKPTLLELKKDEQGIKVPTLTTTGIPNTKSLSQQYRDVLYIYYTQKYGTLATSFEAYYERVMQERIEHVRLKIDELKTP